MKYLIFQYIRTRFFIYHFFLISLGGWELVAGSCMSTKKNKKKKRTKKTTTTKMDMWEQEEESSTEEGEQEPDSSETDEAFFGSVAMDELQLRGPSTTDILRPHPAGRNRLNESAVSASVQHTLGSMLPTADLARLGLASRASMSTIRNTQRMRCMTNTEQGLLCVRSLFVANPFNDPTLCRAFCTESRPIILRNIINFVVGDVLVVDFAPRNKVAAWRKERLRVAHSRLISPKEKKKTTTTKNKPKKSSHLLSKKTARFVATRFNIFNKDAATASLAAVSADVWHGTIVSMMKDDGTFKNFRPENEYDVGSMISRSKNLYNQSTYQPASAQWNIQIYFDLQDDDDRKISFNDVIVGARISGHDIVSSRVEVLDQTAVKLKFYV